MTDRQRVMDAIQTYLTDEIVVVREYGNEVVVDGVISLADLADAILKSLRRQHD